MSCLGCRLVCWCSLVSVRTLFHSTHKHLFLGVQWYYDGKFMKITPELTFYTKFSFYILVISLSLPLSLLLIYVSHVNNTPDTLSKKSIITFLNVHIPPSHYLEHHHHQLSQYLLSFVSVLKSQQLLKKQIVCI